MNCKQCIQIIIGLIIIHRPYAVEVDGDSELHLHLHLTSSAVASQETDIRYQNHLHVVLLPDTEEIRRLMATDDNNDDDNSNVFDQSQTSWMSCTKAAETQIGDVCSQELFHLVNNLNAIQQSISIADKDKISPQDILQPFSNLVCIEGEPWQQFLKCYCTGCSPTLSSLPDAQWTKLWSDAKFCKIIPEPDDDLCKYMMPEPEPAIEDTESVVLKLWNEVQADQKAKVVGEEVNKKLSEDAKKAAKGAKGAKGMDVSKDKPDADSKTDQTKDEKKDNDKDQDSKKEAGKGKGKGKEKGKGKGEGKGQDVGNEYNIQATDEGAWMDDPDLNTSPSSKLSTHPLIYIGTFIFATVVTLLSFFMFYR